MPKPLPPTRFSHASALLKTLCGLAAAAVLPWAATWLTMHLPHLHNTPLLLGFATVTGFALLVSLPSGLVASASTALAFNYMTLTPADAWSKRPFEMAYTLAVFLAAVIAALLADWQRVTQKHLRAAKNALEGQSEALMDAQRGSNSAAWRMDTGDRRFRWAAGGAAIFGRQFSEMVRIESLSEVIIPVDRDYFEAAVDHALYTGGPFRVEFRVVWPDEQLHWIEARGGQAPGNDALWRGVMIDVTDRKQAELALLNAEKLAAAGRVSNTVAHEINNPLEAVTNLIFLAAEDPNLLPETRAYLVRADSELARLGGIARHSLDLARKQGFPSPGDLTEAAEDVVVFFQSRCRSRAGQIRIAGHAKRLPVAAPMDELRQIVTNLVSNACDALPNGGGLVEVVLSAEGKSAVLEVHDNGSGIAPEDRPRVFEPFFTTKQETGTGIGLTVVRELVERNGGRILIVSSGPTAKFRTTFRLELPRA